MVMVGRLEGVLAAVVLVVGLTAVAQVGIGPSVTTGSPTFSEVTITPGHLFVEGHVHFRETFEQPHIVIQTDFTGPVITDGAENFVLYSPIGAITYREEQAKGTSSWVDNDGSTLDISADNTVNDEGVEILIANAAEVTGHLIARQSAGCFEVRLGVGLIAGTDQFLIGWREVEAFDAANDYTQYPDWSIVGINNVDGSIFSLGEVNDGGTLSDDSGVNFADGDVRQLKVCIDLLGVPTAFYTGDDSDVYRAIVMTNSGTAKTSGSLMAPFITYIHSANAVDTAPTIEWMQIMVGPPS